MIIEKEVEIKVNSQTLKYYQSLGYKCKVNDIILIKNEKLKKRENTFLERFGVKNPLQNKEILEKLEQTNLQKYGVKNPSQVPEIKAKSMQTLAERGEGKNF